MFTCVELLLCMYTRAEQPKLLLCLYTCVEQPVGAFSPSAGTRRLRIGYLSADFVDHPTADLIQSALLKHDKSRFGIFLYSISRNDESEYRHRLKEGVEHFVQFSQRTRMSYRKVRSVRFLFVKP